MQSFTPHYYCRLYAEFNRISKELNQLDEKFITALENDDVLTIEHMLMSDEISLRHKICQRTVLTWIMQSISPNLIKMTVTNYPDVFLGRSDQFIELTSCLWDEKYNKSPACCKRTGDTMASESYTRGFECIDLLIELHHEHTSGVQLIEAIFGKSDGVSPFTLSCRLRLAGLVAKYLSLVTDANRVHLREEWFDSSQTFGRCGNIFHFGDSLPVDLVKAIIDRLPFSRSLLNMNRSDIEHPLLTLGILICPDSTAMARLYVHHGGAQVDPLNQRGSTPLLMAIKRGDLIMVECFLRMGAQTDIVDREGNTALSLAMRFGDDTRRRRDDRLRMVELLLASGVDLGKEACLRTPVPPNPNEGVQKTLRELCHLRDSNSMNSLARSCRKVIRRQMGPNADEKIKEETIRLPQHLKAYLLIENEPTLLVGESD